jgi:hypothetical protein
MIVVFWLEKGYADFLEPRFESFSADQLSEALKLAESLRVRRRTGEIISHVCVQSEMPESVGQAGVSDPSTDYAWSKRRIDPSIPLGRPKPGEHAAGSVGSGPSDDLHLW